MYRPDIFYFEDFENPLPSWLRNFDDEALAFWFQAWDPLDAVQLLH